MQNAVSKLNYTFAKLKTWSSDNPLAINAIRFKYFICSSNLVVNGGKLLDLESNSRLFGMINTQTGQSTCKKLYQTGTES